MKATIRKAEFGKVKAFANIEVAPGLTIDGFKVVEGKEGPWVALPSRKSEKDGKVTYFDTVHLTKDLKDQVSKTILEAFKG